MSVAAPPLALSSVSFHYGSDAQRVRQAAVEVNSGALSTSKQGAGRGNDLSSLYLGTVDGICASCILGPRGDHACPGHDERDPEEWQRWWNKNKKKDWDEEE